MKIKKERLTLNIYDLENNLQSSRVLRGKEIHQFFNKLKKKEDSSAKGHGRIKFLKRKFKTGGSKVAKATKVKKTDEATAVEKTGEVSETKRSAATETTGSKSKVKKIGQHELIAKAFLGLPKKGKSIKDVAAQVHSRSGGLLASVEKIVDRESRFAAYLDVLRRDKETLYLITN